MRQTIIRVPIAIFAAGLLLAADSGDTRMKRVEDRIASSSMSGSKTDAGGGISEWLSRRRVPGVSVAVLRDGKLDWAQGYGVRSKDGMGGVTAATRFQAASLSKPVTALLAMRLVELGQLALDEDVNVRLKSWRIPENEFTRGKKVTLRALLSHTAGLNVSGFDGYAAGAVLPTLRQLLDGLPPANSAPIRVGLVPDKKFSYSGGGYAVIQQLIEDVTGKPFQSVAQELVLGPLGMEHSTFAPHVGANGEEFAAGHLEDGGMVPGGWHTYPELAAAGLWTTPSDLALLVQEMQKPGKLLTAASVETMLTGVGGDYGLGFGLGKTGSARSFKHNGGNAGYRCQFFAYREGGNAAVVMTNSDAGMPVVNDVLSAIAAEYDWPDYRQKE